MKKARLIIAVSLICITLLTSVNNVMASSLEDRESRYLLSMSEEECVEFLIQKGIKFPDDYGNLYIWGDYIKRVMYNTINYRGYIVNNSYEPTRLFGERIQSLIYSLVPSTFSATLNDTFSITSTYSLIYSATFCPWSDAYFGYNCYAFALGKTDHSYHPGQIANVSYNISYPIATLANSVCQDLAVDGHTVVSCTTTVPSIGAGQQLICIRKGSSDFHFMRYISSISQWRHKPGNDSQPLKYLYTPSNSLSWTNEYSSEGIDYPGNTTYNSTIYYILFQ